MEWLNKQVSLYRTHWDNTGRAATLRDILLNDFEKNLNTIVALRKLNRKDSEYDFKKKKLKSMLQCYTPAALLETKAEGKLKEIQRTGIMQLDFDHQDIREFDIEELKRCVFCLPFVAFCGLSASGDGFYALILIEEPYRLSEYAQHCFEVFAGYGIKADTSKGKKPENLRYVSYDANMLIRERPKPLRIRHLRHQKKAPAPELTKRFSLTTTSAVTSTRRLIDKGLSEIAAAQVGNRWQTVQKWAFTLGGTADENVLSQIQRIIINSSQFFGLAEKYCRCAEVCFEAGCAKPMNIVQYNKEKD